MTTVNGVTLKKSEKQDGSAEGAEIDEDNQSAIKKRNEVPIANIYFKFSHKDLSQKHLIQDEESAVLTNKYQEIIIDELLAKIDQKI